MLVMFDEFELWRNLNKIAMVSAYSIEFFIMPKLKSGEKVVTHDFKILKPNKRGWCRVINLRK